jgi:hypothetical protein
MTRDTILAALITGLLGWIVIVTARRPKEKDDGSWDMDV